METTDLIFSFCEQLDVKIALSYTEFDKYLEEIATINEFISFLLDFLGIF